MWYAFISYIGTYRTKIRIKKRYSAKGKIMNETISSILTAEKQAEETIERATEAAKETVYNAEQAADKLKKAAAEEVKTRRAENVKTIAAKSDEVYAAEIKLGEERAEELKKAVSGKINACADEVVKEIIG